MDLKDSMSQTAERMTPDPKSRVLTFGELAQQLIKDFQRKGRRVDTLRTSLNKILPILGDVPVPDLGEKHCARPARCEPAADSKHSRTGYRGPLHPTGRLPRLLAPSVKKAAGIRAVDPR